MAVQNINNLRRGRQQSVVIKSGTQQRVGATLPNLNQLGQQARQNIDRNLQTANPVNLGGAFLYTSQYGDEALADAKRRAAQGDVVSQLYVNANEALLKPVQETFARDSKSDHPVVQFTSGLVQTLPNAIAAIPAGLQAVNLLQRGDSSIIKKGYTSIPGIVTDTISVAKDTPLAFAGSVVGGAALGGAGAAGRVSVSKVPKTSGKVQTNAINTPLLNSGSTKRTGRINPRDGAKTINRGIGKKIKDATPTIIINIPDVNIGGKGRNAPGLTAAAKIDGVRNKVQKKREAKWETKPPKITTVKNTAKKSNVRNPVGLTAASKVDGARKGIEGRRRAAKEAKWETKPPKITTVKKTTEKRKEKNPAGLAAAAKAAGVKNEMERRRRTAKEAEWEINPPELRTVPDTKGRLNSNRVVVDLIPINNIESNQKSIPKPLPIAQETIIDGDIFRIVDAKGQVLFEAPLPAHARKGSQKSTKQNSESTKQTKPTNEKPVFASSSGGNVLLMNKPERMVGTAPSKSTKPTKKITRSQPTIKPLTKPKNRVKTVSGSAGAVSLMSLPKNVKPIEGDPEEPFVEIVEEIITDTVTGGMTTTVNDTKSADTSQESQEEGGKIISTTLLSLRTSEDTASTQKIINTPISDTVSSQRIIRKTATTPSPKPDPNRRGRPKDDEEEKKKKKKRKTKTRTYRQKVNPLPWLEDPTDTSWTRKDLTFMRMPANVKVTAVRPLLEAYNEKVKAYNAARKKLRSTAGKTTAEGRKAIVTLKSLYKAANEARQRALDGIEKNRR